ncbi:Rho termination factor N-terminal domain-containing protein [Mycoplasma todarodis]|uniref:Rho termination factor N-terminal domain-containing protein n=1 Tax=Mycoplasma todarodis TaxID=1937191 RepID=UPI003B2AEDB5
MNPFFQANTPTTKEMWKNEPNKFRQWIILLGISLIVFLALTIAGLALVLADRDTLHASIERAAAKTNGISDPSKAASQKIIISFIAAPMIMMVMTIISIGLYASTLVKSYKSKTFSKLSGAAILLPEIIGMFSLFGAIWSSWNLISIVDRHPGALLTIASQYFSVVLLVFAWQVSRIRKTFIHVERMEALRKSPEFQQMQEQMKSFFNAAQNGQTPSSAYGPSSNAQPADIKETPTEVKEAPEVTELKKLKIEELREIASKLSISGSEKMSKDELVSTIIRVTNEG